MFKNKVYNTAIGYVQHEGEAEEITQDVFVTIYNKAYTFKGKSKVSTWIYRMTVNKSLNVLDTRGRRPQSGIELQSYHKINFNHPGIILEHKEKAQFLFQQIDKLTDKQKTAFVLTFVEGLPQQEVADIMETSVKAIESLLQRAKANLRKALIFIHPEGKSKK